MNTHREDVTPVTPCSSSRLLEQQHAQLFKPLDNALTGKETDGTFKIFTLTDYSIPMYYSNRTSQGQM